MAKAPKKPKHPKNTLREWREFRGLTQADLAKAVKPPTNASVISLLETQERGLSNKWLERLAPALRTRKGFLIDVDPNSIDTQVLQAWVDISDNDKPRALSILEALRQKA
jgi:transcriptional regulator with XRE-family HTH domain